VPASAARLRRPVVVAQLEAEAVVQRLRRLAQVLPVLPPRGQERGWSR